MVRIKERYLLVNILYPSDLDTKPEIPDLVALNQPTTDQLTAQVLLRAIRAEISNMFGDYGSGAMATGLSVKYISPATSSVILRVARNHYRLLWTALTMMDRVPVKNGKPCVFRVVHVGGTIRKVEEEAIRRARDMIFAVRGQSGTKETGALERRLGRRQKTEPSVLSAVSDAGDESDEDMGNYSDD